MTKDNYDFSIIIPTHSGVEFIESCLDSIRLSLKNMKVKYEIIVVIDGENSTLESIVAKQKRVFQKLGIKITTNLFKNNRGRFEAGLRGAETAGSDQLILVDDRVELSIEFFKAVMGSQEIVMPNVVEDKHKNGISRTLYLIRKKVYGGKWGEDFEDYYITEQNFDSTPKGTGALWIVKESFLSACREVKSQYANGDTSSSSDDTKVLRTLLQNGSKILKKSSAIIVYNSRSTSVSELAHIYNRGPKFIDYYFNPSKKYFLPILLAVICPLIFTGALIKWNILSTSILIAILTNLLMSIYLKIKWRDTIVAFIGMPLVCLFFWLGLMKGLAKYISTKVSRNFMRAILLSIILFGFLFYVKNNQSTFSRLKDIQLFYLLIIACAHLITIFLNGLFVKFILQPFKKKVPMGESFFVSLISTMGNYFLPIGTGTGIKAVYLKKKFALTYSDFMSTLSGNYIIVFLVNSLLGLVSIVMISKVTYTNISKELLALFIFYSLVFSSTLFLAFFGFPVKAAAVLERHKILKTISGLIKRVLVGWNFIILNKRLLLKLLTLTLLNFFVGMMIIYTAVYALDLRIEIAPLMLYTSLVSMSFLLNLTPGSIGLREAVLIAVNTTLGLAIAEILSVSLIINGVLFFVLILSWLSIQIKPIKSKILPPQLRI